MDNYTPEQELRREAIRRRLEGERRCDICCDLERSPSWFSKWWAEYQQHPQTDFSDQSRKPQTFPNQIPVHVEQAIIQIRKRFEAGKTSETRYGLIGHRAIGDELERLQVIPLPSSAAIQRILAKNGLTHKRGVTNDDGYYPERVAWAPNTIQATDIITRHVQGGQVIQNFHTLDHYTHCVHLSQYLDKTSTSACLHLISTWSDLGLPVVQQFDNEEAFSGGHTHPRVIGRVVRVCLFLGVEPLFIPVYEAKRNYWIESFHSLWVRAFWSRHRFKDLNEIETEAPQFSRWYHTKYKPPCLKGKTPAQMRKGVKVVRLTKSLQRLIPDELPITQGRIHFIRKVDTLGNIRMLNETWPVGQRWIGEYVWTTADTAEQTLTFWYQSENEADWKCLKTRRFKLKQPVHRLLPSFRRNYPRCPDQWLY